jgi:glutaredoxin
MKNSSKIYLGPNPVMFGDSSCPACMAQIKMLMDKYPNEKIIYYDLSKYDAPQFITDRDGSISMPTWVFPDGKIHRGVIKDLSKLIKKRQSAFGKCTAGDGTVPVLDSLVQCGKNFPGGEGNLIPNSFSQTIKEKWGTDYLNAGIGGFRSLGPNSNDTYYSNNYFNDIRMAHPSDQLGTSLALNRTCNQMKSNVGDNTYGLIYNSPNPQIVGFGRKAPCKKNRKNNFGYLYNQMGNAYANAPLVSWNTVRGLYGGGIQNDLPRPRSVQNKDIFIGQVNDYNPIKSNGPNPVNPFNIGKPKPKKKKN